ncbi:phosphoserine aminotransferase [Schizosaccharomyces japonicus yFS275]|uniref:Phosphoserine aminotransferase n=1 Tax=Schizosaccharomyces japonicus (strain yFS275 / FY16936) TaxID=402676 RepID=B6K167_SCHJY|nr:phosphoserine aminotransferase [Schizosaccharomyces japonicus yFS275]EEB07688.1 phosphoserine aminotransferase [Schizosaccharomyces japonicus yFS275]
MPSREQVANFAAGPAAMLTPVVEQFGKDFVNFLDLGMGVAEISHRSKQGGGIVSSAEENLRKLYKLPDDFSILFMQGGGTEQFAAVLYNIYAHHAAKRPEVAKDLVANYVVTGAWSKKAYLEAERLGFPCHIAVDMKQVSGKYDSLPRKEDLNFTPADKTAFVYYCDNETVHGVEFNGPLEHVPEGVIRVVDTSSNFISRKMDFSHYDVVFAGAQKNAGPAGITIVFVRNSILERPEPKELHKVGIPVGPTVGDYKIMADNHSLYNTLPIATLHAINLGFDYMLAHGGLENLENESNEKSQLLYQTLEKYPLFKVVVKPEARSRMNITFRIEPESLEAEFLSGAEKLHLMQLKGHRSVGGIRASLYNAVTLEQTKRLVAYVEEFAKSH